MLVWQLSSCALAPSNGVYYVTINSQAILTTCTGSVGVPNYILAAGTPTGYLPFDRCEETMLK